ncbi:MAG TPA: ribosome silencing factor [Gammaproteobacteria bacterium]|nr:ribosome silencing factor [Gammaproteobacteria bacterium]
MSSSKRPAVINKPEFADDPRVLAGAVVAALEEVKGVAITTIDVRGKTPLTDFLVIASGNSERHLLTLRDAVLECAAGLGIRPLGVEGAGAAEWILIDLVDCVVHLMRPAARAFYDLERLWSVGPEAAPPSS